RLDPPPPAWRGPGSARRCEQPCVGSVSSRGTGHPQHTLMVRSDLRSDTRVTAHGERAGPLQAIVERVLSEGIIVLNETVKARLECLASGSRRQTPRSRCLIGPQNRKHHNTCPETPRQYPASRETGKQETGNGQRATGSQARLLTASRFPFPVAGPYLISTVAPSASSLVLICSASALLTFSFTGLGAPSTRSLASLSPSPVSSRTTLMTWIFLSPMVLRMASNSVCSSTACAVPAAPPPAGAAAIATGAAAVTPNFSSSAFTSSASSRTVRLPIASTISSLFIFTAGLVLVSATARP